MATGQHIIKGHITDSDGYPLSFVTIRVVNPSLIYSSNDSGFYNIEIPQHYNNVILKFELMGMETKVTKLSLPTTSFVDIMLASSSLP